MLLGVMIAKYLAVAPLSARFVGALGYCAIRVKSPSQLESVASPSQRS